MAKKTYQIVINGIEGLFMREVQGRKVKIEGYEDFEFFIHRPYNPNLNIPENMTGWVVSESSTGWKVASAFYQHEATEKAKKNMASVTREQFLSKLDKARQFLVDNQRSEAVS